MKILFNVNDLVQVKLTEIGRARLRERQIVKTETNGVSQFQLHELMHAFGDLMIPHTPVTDLPFETDVVIKYL